MSTLKQALGALNDWWDTAGVEVDALPVSTAQTKKPPLRKAPPKRAPNPVQKAAPAERPAFDKLKQAASAAPTREALFEIIKEMDAGELSLTATQPVFFRGNPEAKIMAIGEAPGADEDRQGQPFVGKSGQLLDRIFASIGLGENDIYISNVVNFRPPGNRKPSTDEIELFRPIIRRHVELIAPDYIILIGGVSLEAMMDTKGIMKNRGRWMDYDILGKGVVTALPIYHPAFLLRRPELKADMWRDMLALKARLSAPS